MYGPRLHPAVAFVTAIISILSIPAAAQAHGGSTRPVATNYLAKVRTVPAGLDAKVVDGDLRMWLRAPLSAVVIVLDPRGAPYLRFDRSGVQVNHNSAMYYLNQTPVAQIPPSNLTASTPPDWHPAGSSHDYSWHEGRLHALATVALAPGTSYVGTWTIPIMIGGHRTAITGGLWHADRPSLVWFWPILVLLACVLAAWRLRRPTLDAQLARALGITALLALALAAAGQELHGHPTVSPFQYVELGIILLFVAWGLSRLTVQQHGYFTLFVIAFAVLWQGLTLISVLRDGFVLINLPAFVARTATMLCLACGVSILVLAFRIAELPERATGRTRATTTADPDLDDLDEAWEIS